MTQMHNANASHPVTDHAGRMTVVLPKPEMVASSTSDPLPWLIRNLRDKQRAERQAHASETKPQASTGGVNPVG